MKRQGTFILALVAFMLFVIFYDAIKQIVIITALALAGLIGITFTVAVVMVGWYVIERMKMLRATRIEAEKNAHVLTLSNNGQVFVRDTDHKAVWHALHLEQRVYSNGQYVQPSPFEAKAWEVFNGPKRTATIKPELLPALVQPVNLLDALETVQRCLIVGASDTGKTTLLQHIINRRVQNSKVIVIDPHAYPKKWAGCSVAGTGRNYGEIEKALTALVQIMTKRYDEIGKGVMPEMGHPRITILIDEWRAIIANVKPAGEAIKALLTESRKAAFSVFVATHSDRAKPLGLEGEYDLKDGFAVVRLTVINGQRQATFDTGNGELPVMLPGPYHGHYPQVIDAGEFINLDVKPTAIEAEILNLHSAGNSISAIAAQVFGSKGGNQNQQVKDVLSKYDAV
jgi:hypothetical protein